MRLRPIMPQCGIASHEQGQVFFTNNEIYSLDKLHARKRHGFCTFFPLGFFTRTSRPGPHIRGEMKVSKTRLGFYLASVAAVGLLGFSGASHAFSISGWSCTGTCGVLGANGVVTASPYADGDGT